MNTVTQEAESAKTKSGNTLPSVGSIVEGKLVARDRSAAFVDLGIWGTGIIYGREFYAAKNIIKSLNIGDTVQGKLVEMENEDGYRELSLKEASAEMNWNKLKEIKENGETLEVKIKGVNKGGLLTHVDNLPAFLPVSQLSPENYPRVSDANKQTILRELQKFIGKTLEVKILDISVQESKLILSEKARTEETTKEILKNYKVGDIIEGEITGVTDFGAFIRFPLNQQNEEATDAAEEANVDEADDQEKENKAPLSIEGLIHISELDWQLIQNPSEVVSVGDVIKAKIINIENNQVFLSVKSLSANPWEEIEKEYKKGDTIKGKVITINSFGAFVEVNPKIRGLCHISEFTSEEESEQKESGEKKMKDTLKIGETYEFEILSIEPKEHKMGLRVKN